MYLKKDEKYLIKLLSVSLYDTIGLLILKPKNMRQGCFQ